MSHDERGRILPGSRVRVDYVPPTHPEHQFHFLGTLLGRPADVGDTFRVRFDGGRVVEINPSCSTFESIAEVDDPELVEAEALSQRILHTVELWDNSTCWFCAVARSVRPDDHDDGCLMREILVALPRGAK